MVMSGIVKFPFRRTLPVPLLSTKLKAGDKLGAGRKGGLNPKIHSLTPFGPKY